MERSSQFEPSEGEPVGQPPPAHRPQPGNGDGDSNPEFGGTANGSTDSTPSTVTTQSEPSTAPSRQSAASRRAGPVVGVLVLLIVVAAVVAAIAVGAGGDDNSDGSDGNDGTSDPSVSRVTDRPTACRIELTALVNLSLGSDLNTLLGVIGSQSELFAPTQIAATTFQSDTTMYGNSEAQRRIGPAIAAQCTRAENPILTRGQMQDLLQAATASVDTDELRRIAIFA